MDPPIETRIRLYIYDKICVKSKSDKIKFYDQTPSETTPKTTCNNGCPTSGDSTQGLKLNIFESDNSQDLELAKEVAEYFRINQTRINKIIQEVIYATKTDEKKQNQLGLLQVNKIG